MGGKCNNTDNHFILMSLDVKTSNSQMVCC